MHDISSVIEKVASEYDGFNRLIERETVKQGVRSIVTFTYDGDDLRTEKRSRSSDRDYEEEVVRYVYDRQYVILEANGEDDTVTRYVRGSRYIARIDVSDQSMAYYVYNGHADVVQTVTESGEQLNAYEYDIFGNPTLTIETHANAIRYAGEFYDAETGLYYLRARYYAPYIGRFITEDTYKGDILNPLSLNLYTYVLNDPINFWDPTGHWQQGDEELLNVVDQAKIIALTTAYNHAQTTGEKEKIHLEAKKIRDKAAKARKEGTYNMNVVTPLLFNIDAIVQVMNEAANTRGYMTGDEWDSAVRKAGIQVSTYKETSGNSSIPSREYQARTETVTIIGRTELKVESQFTLKSNRQFSEAKLNMRYLKGDHEEAFISQLSGLAVDKEGRQFSEVEMLVMFDILQANDGKLTKEAMQSFGLGYYADVLVKRYDDSLAFIESGYHHARQGYSRIDMILGYEQQEESITDLAGMRIRSGKGSLPVYNNASTFKANTSKGPSEQTTKTGNQNSTEPKPSTSIKQTPTRNAAGCNCFTAGTKVLTDEGEKSIEEIEVGDKVLAKDDETGEMAYKEVEWLFQRDVEETYNITVGGEIITTTDEHPFWIVGKGWVEAQHLAVGNILTTSDGKELAIEKFEVKQEHKTVYNFKVKDFHTYFVSNLGVWTHNACGPYQWGNKNTLQDHFDRHGSNFGAKNPTEYAQMANDFFKNRNKYEVKVDTDGTIRVYDPKTNTFGSYNADGTSKTFFKPTRGRAYWDDQPGK